MLLSVFYYCICGFLCCFRCFNLSLCRLSPFLLSYVTVSSHVPCQNFSQTEPYNSEKLKNKHASLAKKCISTKSVMNTCHVPNKASRGCHPFFWGYLSLLYWPLLYSCGSSDLQDANKAHVGLVKCVRGRDPTDPCISTGHEKFVGPIPPRNWT